MKFICTLTATKYCLTELKLCLTRDQKNTIEVRDRSEMLRKIDNITFFDRNPKLAWLDKVIGISKSYIQ